MWRKSLHDRYGYFDETFSSSGDWEFWLRIAEGTRFQHIPEFVGLYLYSDASAEHRNPVQRINEDLKIRREYMPKYIKTLKGVETTLNMLQGLEKFLPDNDTVTGLKQAFIQKKSALMESQQKETVQIGLS